MNNYLRISAAVDALAGAGASVGQLRSLSAFTKGLDTGAIRAGLGSSGGGVANAGRLLPTMGSAGRAIAGGGIVGKLSSWITVIGGGVALFNFLRGLGEDKPQEALDTALKDQEDHEAQVEDGSRSIDQATKAMGQLDDHCAHNVEEICDSVVGIVRMLQAVFSPATAAATAQPILLAAVQAIAGLLCSRNGALEAALNTAIGDHLPAAEPGRAHEPVCKDSSTEVLAEQNPAAVECPVMTAGAVQPAGTVECPPPAPPVAGLPAPPAPVMPGVIPGAGDAPVLPVPVSPAPKGSVAVPSIDEVVGSGVSIARHAEQAWQTIMEPLERAFSPSNDCAESPSPAPIPPSPEPAPPAPPAPAPTLPEPAPSVPACDCPPPDPSPMPDAAEPPCPTVAADPPPAPPAPVPPEPNCTPETAASEPRCDGVTAPAPTVESAGEPVAAEPQPEPIGNAPTCDAAPAHLPELPDAASVTPPSETKPPVFPEEALPSPEPEADPPAPEPKPVPPAPARQPPPAAQQPLAPSGQPPVPAPPAPAPTAPDAAGTWIPDIWVSASASVEVHIETASVHEPVSIARSGQW